MKTIQNLNIFFFKFLFLLFFPIQLLYAQTMQVDYRVEFGMIGTIGKVHTVYHDDGKKYIIDTHLSAEGFIAQSVTHHLKERHVCKGTMTKDKRRTATSYQMFKRYGKYRSTTLYRVDHRDKKIIKTYKKWLLKKGKPERKIQDYTYDLDYYAVDDMVTLFLNLSYKIKNKTNPKSYRFKAVGADKEHGNVDITIPTKKQAKEMSGLLGKAHKGEWLMNLVMHRQLYGSKQGELMVRMSKESTIEKAVLKDLFFFGDVRIVRVFAKHD